MKEGGFWGAEAASGAKRSLLGPDGPVDDGTRGKSRDRVALSDVIAGVESAPLVDRSLEIPTML